MPNISENYVQWRELAGLFNSWKSPSLMKILDSKNIPYIKDSAGKPIVERALLEGEYAKADEGADKAMQAMETAISEFSTTITASPE